MTYRDDELAALLRALPPAPAHVVAAAMELPSQFAEAALPGEEHAEPDHDPDAIAPDMPDTYSDAYDAPGLEDFGDAQDDSFDGG